jgi:geranylgeranyl transferase type-2 subunit beta
VLSACARSRPLLQRQERQDIKLPEERPRALLQQLHLDYIVGWTTHTDSFEYVMAEYLRMSGLYWCLTALHLLDRPDAMDRNAILGFVAACFHPDKGGFSAAPQNDPHLLYTLSAVQILTLYDAVEPQHVEAVSQYVARLQRPDGSFAGDEWEEVDSRFSFCALACLKLLGRLEAVNVEKAAAHVLACMNFDGGFGVGPLSESHAGQIFCCVGALAITGTTHLSVRAREACLMVYLASHACHLQATCTVSTTTS